MNREIKFRAWDGSKMQYAQGESPAFDFWADGYWELCDHRKLTADTVNPRIVCNSDSSKLMQYTGLKDKNDEEIYEGDIVREQMKNTFGSYNEQMGSVYYNTQRGGFAVERPDDEEHEWTIGAECEVVGNIYENPELLKV